MAELYLFNSLTRKKEPFEAIKPPHVGMYTCGMTVYDYAHIGHGRKYVIDDVLKRVLIANGYKVTQVENVTDVGHLVSDADSGEDKMEKGAKKQGKTVWEVAKFFMDNFYESMDKLNITRPDVICRATDNVKEQIAMIEKIMANGFAYDTPEAVYFDVTKFPKYDGLFGQKMAGKKVAVRKEVEEGEYKKHPADFVLWFKRVGRFQDHIMHWDSPWGDGFPGWHIECSAMSTKYLGDQFDIHTGGEDHLPVHHPNEIAQSEAATGKSPFVKYWIHTAFLMVDSRKMSKSLGNFYTVDDIEKKGFDPLSLRYLYLTAHYRDPLNFTWTSLEGAGKALENLRKIMVGLKDAERKSLSEEKLVKVDGYREKFMAALGDDLNTPQAIAVLWEVLKSNIPSEDKYDLAMSFDEILGLDLGKEEKIEIPEEITKLGEKRLKLRKENRFEEADEVRLKIEKLGFNILDTKEGIKYERKS